MLDRHDLLGHYRERRWEPGETYELDGSGLWLPPAAVPATPAAPLGVEFFAGAGGMSCGFHMAGIHVIAASEAWHTAAITYLLNLGSPDTLIHVLEYVPDKMQGKRARQLHAERTGDTLTASEFLAYHGVGAAAGSAWIKSCMEPGPDSTDDEPTRATGLPCEHLYVGDVRQLHGERILVDLGLDEGDIDVVAGGPPCQGFSLLGKRNMLDPRNSLVFDFARLVLELKPKTMVMENVPGIISMVTPEGIPVIDAFCRVLEHGGFGGYDALRKSILTSAGCGGALRELPKSPRPRRNPAAEQDDDGQLDLALFDPES